MWKPGDVALCIEPRPYPPEVLKESRTYTVTDTSGSCCTTRLVLSEVLKAPPEFAGAVCLYCMKPAFGFCHWRFIKIAGNDPSVNLEGENNESPTLRSPEGLVGKRTDSFTHDLPLPRSMFRRYGRRVWSQVSRARGSLLLRRSQSVQLERRLQQSSSTSWLTGGGGSD